MKQERRSFFPSTSRLRKRQDFTLVRSQGDRLKTDHFYIYLLANDRDRSRLGLTVSRKIGNAVTRNRIKRILREYFRTNRELSTAGYDISIIVRRKIEQHDWRKLKDELNILPSFLSKRQRHG